MYLFRVSDGTRLHYDKKGRGKPLYFFHPPALGAAVFREQTPLSRFCKIVALNARGHGASEGGKGPISNEQWADDIYELAEHERDRRITVCGYSSGTEAALAFALRYPEKTAGVVLVGGFPLVDTWMLNREFHLGIWAAKQHLQSLIAAVLPRTHTKHRETRSRIAATIRDMDAKVLEKWYRAGLHADYSMDLPRLTAPLLLIYGTRDRYVHGYQVTYYQQAIRTSVQSVYIDGVGHQVPTRRSKELNAVLTRFLAGIDKNRDSAHATHIP